MLINGNSYNSTNTNDSIQLKNFYKFKIILLGDTGVGKSCLLGRYMDEKFLKYRPCTIFADYKIKSIIIDNLTSAQITIWDTCGQEKYRSLTRQFYKDAQGIILIFDVNNKKSFSNLNIWLEEIKNNSKEDASIVLCGNKIDLNRNVSFEEAYNFANNHNLIYCESSSKDGINVESAFEKVTIDIVDKINLKHKFEDEIDKTIFLNPSIKAVRGKERIKEKNEKNCC